MKNAINGDTAQQLVENFRQFDGDNSYDVAILHGNGGNFCAGADLKALANGNGANHISVDSDAPLGPSRMLLTKPVIAAVEGYAVLKRRRCTGNRY